VKGSAPGLAAAGGVAGVGACVPGVGACVAGVGACVAGVGACVPGVGACVAGVGACVPAAASVPTDSAVCATGEGGAVRRRLGELCADALLDMKRYP
jgi:hypothetical protein